MGAPEAARVVGGGRAAAAGTGLIALGVLLIGALHVLPPSNRVNPMTRTISEYALGGNGWLFDLAVLAIAAGSIALLVPLVRAGVLRAAGAPALLVATWSAALAVLVVFEKYNYTTGGTGGTSGLIHRMASLVAFVALPAGLALAAAAGLRDRRWRGPAAWTLAAALLSWACLALLFYAIGQSFVTDVSWWRVFPLGALERLIALAEIAALLVLGRWAALVARSPHPVGHGRGGAALV